MLEGKNRFQLTRILPLLFLTALFWDQDSDLAEKKSDNETEAHAVKKQEPEKDNFIQLVYPGGSAAKNLFREADKKQEVGRFEVPVQESRTQKRIKVRGLGRPFWSNEAGISEPRPAWDVDNEAPWSDLDEDAF